MKRIAEYYQDEAYSREELSWGNRLIVEKEFLKQICKDYNATLYLSKSTKRQFYKWDTDRNPEKEGKCDEIIKIILD